MKLQFYPFHCLLSCYLKDHLYHWNMITVFLLIFSFDEFEIMINQHPKEDRSNLGQKGENSV